MNADERAALLEGDEVFDLADASGGAIPSDPQAVVAGHWDAALALHRAGSFSGGRPMESVRLGPPIPAPRAVFGVGLNYRSHLAETGAPPPELPAIFAKFPTSVTGPYDDIVVPRGEVNVDWEAELAFVVGRGGRHVDAAHALESLAGFMIAQDVSERRLQMLAGRQFSLGKSYDTFCPLGPAIITLDELDDPLDLRMVCRVNGEVMQDASTTDMLTDVPHLVEYLSSVLTLRPGDVCLTGTPAGVGLWRQPPRFLRPGDVVETEIEGLGAMRNRCVAEG